MLPKKETASQMENFETCIRDMSRRPGTSPECEKFLASVSTHYEFMNSIYRSTDSVGVKNDVDANVPIWWMARDHEAVWYKSISVSVNNG